MATATTRKRRRKLSEPRPCAWCQTVWTPTNNYAKCCCRECSSKLYDSLHERVEVPCEKCGHTFQSRMPHPETLCTPCRILDQEEIAAVTERTYPVHADTTFLPGTAGRVAVYRDRVKRGEELWHEGDNNPWKE